jgi:hypothetical protein
MMASYNDFFTLQSLGTFAGAVGGTTVISNGLQRALNFNPKWLALALAEIICLTIVYYTHAGAPPDSQPMSSDYFVAVINGFLVYCSAAGVTTAGGATLGTTKSTAAQSTDGVASGSGTAQARGAPDSSDGTPLSRRRFWSSWH